MTNAVTEDIVPPSSHSFHVRKQGLARSRQVRLIEDLSFSLVCFLFFSLKSLPRSPEVLRTWRSNSIFLLFFCRSDLHQSFSPRSHPTHAAHVTVWRSPLRESLPSDGENATRELRNFENGVIVCEFRMIHNSNNCDDSIVDLLLQCVHFWIPLFRHVDSDLSLRQKALDCGLWSLPKPFTAGKSCNRLLGFPLVLIRNSGQRRSWSQHT